MIRNVALLGLLVAGACAAKAASGLPPVPVMSHSPWDGDWVVSRTRNPKDIIDAAADGYRFQLAGDGRIRWEIPSLHEVVEGHVDGRPMPIRRPGSSGQSLSVTASGAYVLAYRVYRDGKPNGEGRMTLIDQGKAWVDVTQPFGRPDLAAAVIYVRPADADR
jgi:hypothetical protein